MNNSENSAQEARGHRREGATAVYIWLALALLEALAMLADLIGGQDPYRHQALGMLALILCYVCDMEER